MNKLRFIRDLRGFSQEYMAKKLDMEQNTYSRYENDQKKLTPEILKQVAGILGVSEEDITNPEPVVIIMNNQTNGSTGIAHQPIYNVNGNELIDKLIAAKDEIIAVKNEIIVARDEAIATQKEYILFLKSELEHAKKKLA